MNKRKLLSAMLVIAMLLSILPSATTFDTAGIHNVYAAEGELKYIGENGSIKTISQGSCAVLSSMRGPIALHNTTVYITGDVTISGGIVINNCTVILDSNSCFTVDGYLGGDGDITITTVVGAENARVIVNSGEAAGINILGDLNVYGGTVMVKDIDRAELSRGAYVGGTLTMEGNAKFTGTGGNVSGKAAESYGVYVLGGISISGNAELTGNGGTASATTNSASSCGISCGLGEGDSFNVSGGKINGNGGVASAQNNVAESCGIKISGDSADTAVIKNASMTASGNTTSTGEANRTSSYGLVLSNGIGLEADNSTVNVSCAANMYDSSDINGYDSATAYSAIKVKNNSLILGGGKNEPVVVKAKTLTVGDTNADNENSFIRLAEGSLFNNSDGGYTIKINTRGKTLEDILEDGTAVRNVSDGGMCNIGLTTAEGEILSVISHKCSMGNSGVCACGRECMHSMVDEETGTCNDCSKQFPRSVTLGTVALDGAQQSNVYMGSYAGSSNYNGGYAKDPIKWRVLAKDANKLFLLSDKNIDAVKYHTADESVTWAESTIRSWLNGYDSSENKQAEDYTADNFIDTAFSEYEKGLIKTASLSNGSGSNTTDKIFLLSADDVENTEYFKDNNSRAAANTEYVASKESMSAAGAPWWLRTQGSTAKNAAYVSADGTKNTDGAAVNSASYAVRPAFYMDTANVLFTAPANDVGEQIGAVEKNTRYKEKDYRLAMLDSEREFNVNERELSGKLGEMVTFTYICGNTGDNEYISAMLLNDSDEILYYGRIDRANESGSGHIVIPEELKCGTYTLKLFNEQVNGEGMLGFASAFQDISLTVEKATEFSIRLVRREEEATKVRLVAPTAGEYTLIFASYGEDILNKTEAVTVTVTEEEAGYVIERTVNASVERDDKVMLWDNLSSITPMCDAHFVE